MPVVSSEVTQLSPGADRALTDAEIRIRRSAVLLFAQRGYAATGIREIARTAGITSATLYHYTSSKEDLLVQIMATTQRLLLQTAHDALEGVQAPEERLGALVGNLVGAHAMNPMTAIVADTEVRALREGSAERKLVVGLRDQYERLWKGTLEVGADQGVFHFVDEHLTRLALLTMCAGMSHWYRPGSPDTPERLSEKFIDSALGAVHASRDGRWVRASDLSPQSVSDVPYLPFEPRVDRPSGSDEGKD